MAWSIAIAIVTAIGLLAAIGVLGAFYLALDRVEQDYRRQHDLEHQLLRLNAQHSRILQLEKLSALGTTWGRRELRWPVEWRLVAPVGWKKRYQRRRRRRPNPGCIG